MAMSSCAHAPAPQLLAPVDVPVNLRRHFLQREAAIFTLLQSCATVRLWRTQTIPRVIGGEVARAQICYAITVGLDVAVVRMRSYQKAREQFKRDALTQEREHG